MKKMITISIFCLGCLFVNAQQTDITVHINAGELKDSLTTEQMKIVQKLTITGSMDETDLNLIHSNMPKLKEVNIKEVKLDTIPARCFYGNRRLQSLDLPLFIRYVGDYAFGETEIIVGITGMFPELGESVLCENAFSYKARFWVYPDNKYCKEVENRDIHSRDGKILYYFSDRGELESSLLEGTEIIACRAFERAWIRRVIFPTSLKKIDKYAFSNVEIRDILSWYGDSGPLILTFQSEIPPALAPNAFNDKDILSQFYLKVPKGCHNIYKADDPQWSIFIGIIEEGEPDPPSNISLNNSFLQIFKENSYWRISDENIISRIEIINTMGQLVYSEVCNDKTIYIPCNRISGINCLQIYYKDNTAKVIKITN